MVQWEQIAQSPDYRELTPDGKKRIAALYKQRAAENQQRQANTAPAAGSGVTSKWEDIVNDPEFKALPASAKQRLAAAYERQSGTAMTWTDKSAMSAAAGGRAAGGSDDGLIAQFGAGIDETQAALSQTAADVMETAGMSNLSAYLQRVAQNNQQEANQVAAPSLREVDGVGDFMQYGLSSLARSLPSTGAQIGLSFAGPVGMAAAAGLGAATSYGSIRLEQEERGIDDRAAAMMGGATSGLIGMVGLKGAGLLKGTSAPANLVNGITRGITAEAPTEAVQGVVEGLAGGERDINELAWRGLESGVGGGLAGGYLGAGRAAFENRSGITRGLGEAGRAITKQFGDLSASANLEFNGEDEGRAAMYQDALTDAQSVVRNTHRNSPEYLSAVDDVANNEDGLRSSTRVATLAKLQERGMVINNDVLTQEMIDSGIRLNEGLGFSVARKAQEMLTPSEAKADMEKQGIILDEEYRSVKQGTNSILANIDRDIALTDGKLGQLREQRDLSTDPAKQVELDKQITRTTNIRQALAKDRETVNSVYVGISTGAPDASPAKLKAAINFDLASGTNLTTQLQMAAELKGMSAKLQQQMTLKEAARNENSFLRGSLFLGSFGTSAIIGGIAGKTASGVKRRAEKRALASAEFKTPEGGIDTTLQSELNPEYGATQRMEQAEAHAAQAATAAAIRKERGSLTDEELAAQQEGASSARGADVTKGKAEVDAVLDGFTEFDPAKADELRTLVNAMDTLQNDPELFKGVKKKFKAKLDEAKVARKEFNKRKDEEASVSAETETTARDKQREADKAARDKERADTAATNREARAQQHARSITSKKEELAKRIDSALVKKEISDEDKDALIQELEGLNGAVTNKDITDLAANIVASLNLRKANFKKNKATNARASKPKKPTTETKVDEEVIVPEEASAATDADVMADMEEGLQADTGPIPRPFDVNTEEEAPAAATAESTEVAPNPAVQNIQSELRAELENLGDIDPKIMDDLETDIMMLDMVEDVEAAAKVIKDEIARIKKAKGNTSTMSNKPEAPAEEDAGVDAGVDTRANRPTNEPPDNINDLMSTEELQAAEEARLAEDGVVTPEAQVEVPSKPETVSQIAYDSVVKKFERLGNIAEQLKSGEIADSRVGTLEKQSGVLAQGLKSEASKITADDWSTIIDSLGPDSAHLHDTFGVDALRAEGVKFKDDPKGPLPTAKPEQSATQPAEPTTQEAPSTTTPLNPEAPPMRSDSKKAEEAAAKQAGETETDTVNSNARRDGQATKREVKYVTGRLGKIRDEDSIIEDLETEINAHEFDESGKEISRYRGRVSRWKTRLQQAKDRQAKHAREVNEYASKFNSKDWDDMIDSTEDEYYRHTYDAESLRGEGVQFTDDVKAETEKNNLAEAQQKTKVFPRTKAEIPTGVSERVWNKFNGFNMEMEKDILGKELGPLVVDPVESSKIVDEFQKKREKLLNSHSDVSGMMDFKNELKGLRKEIADFLVKDRNLNEENAKKFTEAFVNSESATDRRNSYDILKLSTRNKDEK